MNVFLENYNNFFVENISDEDKYLNISIKDELDKKSEALIVIYFFDMNNNIISDERIKISKNIKLSNERNINIPKFSIQLKIIVIGYVKIKYHMSKIKLYSNKQIQFFEKHNIIKKHIKGTDLLYSLKNNGTSKLIITFPDYSPSPFDEIPFRMGIEQSIKGVSLLSFIDNFDKRGSSFIMNNQNFIIFDEIIKVITEKKMELKIQEKDIIFYGCDKGANIASYFSHHFKKACFIYVAPILDIKQFQKNNIFRLVEDHVIDFIPCEEPSVKQYIVLGESNDAQVFRNYSTILLNSIGLINLRKEAKNLFIEFIQIILPSNIIRQDEISIKFEDKRFFKNEKIVKEVKQTYITKENKLTLIGMLFYKNLIKNPSTLSLLSIRQLYEKSSFFSNH